MDPDTKRRTKLDGYYKEKLTRDRKDLKKIVATQIPFPDNCTESYRLRLQEDREKELDRLIEVHKNIGDYAETFEDNRYKHYVYQYHGCMYHGHLPEDGSCHMSYRPEDLHPLHKSKIAGFLIKIFSENNSRSLRRDPYKR